MRHNTAKVREFMEQEPYFQVAKFVFECMEYRRSEETPDYNPCFDLSLFGVKSRAKAGRPRIRWEDCVLQDLAAVGVQEEDWEDECQLKCVWRKKLWEFSHPTGVAASKGAFRVSGRRGAQAALQHAEHYSLPFAGSAAAAGELCWWEPDPEPTTFVLNPRGSPPPMFP
jgi:hypothetical protein